MPQMWHGAPRRLRDIRRYILAAACSGPVVADDANTPIGINLSSDVYDWNGHSQENGIWVNGTVSARQACDRPPSELRAT